eukprot:910540-Karenia_brevis.AAC.1
MGHTASNGHAGSNPSSLSTSPSDACVVPQAQEAGFSELPVECALQLASQAGHETPWRRLTIQTVRCAHQICKTTKPLHR